jgi:uncharacterized protein
LDILVELFGNIDIPSAVAAELEFGGHGIPHSSIRIHSVARSDYEHLLRRDLDIGEAQTIVLAKTLNADLVLIDERLGYAIAKEEGLPLAGTLTVLVNTKRRGIITEAKPLLDAMIAQNQWYSRQLYNHFLQSVGEIP